MRMAGPDIVLFVVGALLFGGAALAIASQDGDLGAPGSALGIYNVDYSAKSLEVGTQDVADFRSATATFDVNATNVGKVLVTIRCSDTANAVVPFNLQILVEGPNGLGSDDVSGNCAGETVVEIPVSSQPPATTAQGSTPEAAREGLPQLPDGLKAVGAWKVTVSGARGGSPVPVPAGNPGGSVVLSVEQWEPRLTPVQR